MVGPHPLACTRPLPYLAYLVALIGNDCIDEFRHYLICVVLWQLAREALDIRESSCAVGHRLCLSSVNLNKPKLLGFCHVLYHSLRKDSNCFDSNGTVRSGEIVQRRASGPLRALIPLM